MLLGSAVVAAIYLLVGTNRAAARNPNTQKLSFHSGPTLICRDCHTMHYSEDGTIPVDAQAGGPWEHLLLSSNVTDLCLTCHKDATAPDVWSGNWPGGAFSNTGTGGGDQAQGHNPGGRSGNESTNVPLDTVLGLTPPGQTQALNEFHCGTCHEPHGWKSDAVNGNQYSFAYRLLRKQIRGPGGSQVDVSDTLLSGFADEQFGQTTSSTNHNVYRSHPTVGDGSKGFSKWCATCHGGFHSDTQGDPELKDGSGNWIRHPTATALGADVVGNYGTTYDPNYPVETTNTSAGTGANWSVSATTERVFCLSCHRAHASPYTNATRWDCTAGSGIGTGCNKCHKKGS
jgi:hypothetical protein